MDRAEATLGSQKEVLRGMEAFVGDNLSFLVPVEKAWQPSDYLPDLTADDWREQVQRLRDPALGLSDEVLVVLVADMVTEEALPSYSVSLNLIAEDFDGTSERPWARWLRGWTSEENRHGDLLNAYLRLTGRVDMRAVEVTVHHLLNSGFNARAYPDLYGGLVYTAPFGRMADQAGISFTHARFGDVARQAGSLSPAETTFEATYSFNINSHLNLQPDLQYVMSPSGDRAIPDAVVLGSRVIASW